MSSSLLILSLLTLWANAAEMEMEVEKPLVFEAMQGDVRKLKIFWNPEVDVAHVVQLANRDIRFGAANNRTETVGEWRTLVTENDDDDGTKRYVFLKSRLCDEQDWRVSWEDKAGKVHGPLVQRMLPSPIVWLSPDIHLHVDQQHSSYDSATDSVSVPISVTGNNGDTTLLVELNRCDLLFSKPQSEPLIIQNKKIVMPAAFVHSGCEFWLRAEELTYNQTEQCREVHRTDNNSSVLVRVDCLQVVGLQCTKKQNEPCAPDCDLPVTGSGQWVYDADYNVAEPRISLEWTAPKGKVAKYLVRHSQIDRTFLNFAVKEFNATELVMDPSQTHIVLDPFTRDSAASFGIKVCALFDQCDVAAKLDWRKVPLRHIYFNPLIDSLGPPPPPPPPPPSVPAVDNVTVPSTTTSRQETNTEDMPPIVPINKHPGNKDSVVPPKPEVEPPRQPPSSSTKANKGNGAKKSSAVMNELLVVLVPLALIILR